MIKYSLKESLSQNTSRWTWPGLGYLNKAFHCNNNAYALAEYSDLNSSL